MMGTIVVIFMGVVWIVIALWFSLAVILELRKRKKAAKLQEVRGEMIELFKDITEGLVKQGYRINGGNDTGFLILSKDNKVVKVFANDYDKPDHFIVKMKFDLGR